MTSPQTAFKVGPTPVVAPVSPGHWLIRFAPGLIFGLALLVNGLTLWRTGFDGLYGQDAYGYFAHGQELHDHLSLFHHWQWEAEPRRLYWPVGYPATLALWFVLTGTSAGAAQLLSVLAWAGTAGLLTRVGQKLFKYPLVGPLAGLLLALSPLGRQVALSVMADAPALFWTVAAAWLILKGRESGRGSWLVGAGAVLGLAGITRYAALSAWPLIALGALWPGLTSLRPRWVALAGLATLIMAGPQLVINQIYPAGFWTNSWLADWSPANAFQSSFTTRDGFAAYKMPPSVFYLGWSLLNPRLLTPLALPLVGLGLAKLGQGREWWTLTWLVAWWLGPVLMFSPIPYENERYSLTLLPPLALLSGLGLAWVVARVRTVWPSRRMRRIVTAVLVVGFVGLGLLSERHVDGFIRLKELDLTTARQVAATLPSQATLITFDLSLTFDHYTDLKVRDLLTLEQGQIKELAGQPAIYLLADPDHMAQQWAGNRVGQAFEAARASASGPPVGRFGRYVLWKLGP